MSQHNYLDNKYTRWYFSIINNAKQRATLEGYTENHHIIPKCLGGTNQSSNLVRLYAREHFVCHLLLIKMVSDDFRIKMIRAFNAFSISSKKNPRKLTANQYEKARVLTAGIPAWNLGMTVKDYTEKQKEAFRKSGLSKKGRTQTAESNAKRSETLANREFDTTHRAKLSSALSVKCCCAKCRRETTINHLSTHKCTT